MRLLLVEDDAMIGEAVLDLLRAEHYAVDWVKDGEAADTALRTADRTTWCCSTSGCRGATASTVLRALRARKQRMPVLIATARDAVGAAHRRARCRRRRLRRSSPTTSTSCWRASARCCGAPPAAPSRSIEHKGVTHQSGHARSHASTAQPVRAVGARMGRARAAARAARRGAVARPARGKALRLEGRDQQQRGRGLRPRPAQEAGRRPDPQRARGRLHGARANDATRRTRCARACCGSCWRRSCWRRCAQAASPTARRCDEADDDLRLPHAADGAVAARAACRRARRRGLRRAATRTSTSSCRSGRRRRASVPHRPRARAAAARGARLLQRAGATAPPTASSRSQTGAQVDPGRAGHGARGAAWRGTLALRTRRRRSLLMAPLLMLVVWWVVSRSLAPVARVRRQVADAPGRRPVAAQRSRPARGGAAAGARAEPAVRARAPGLRGAAALRRRRRARAALAAGGAQAAGAGRCSARPTTRARKLAVGAADRRHRPRDAPGRAAAGAGARSEASAATGAQPAAARPGATSRATAMADACAGGAGAPTSTSACTRADAARRCRATPEALRILVRNLLDNAIKYTPAGGTRRRRRSRAAAAACAAERRRQRPRHPAERARARVRPLLPRAPARGPGSGLGLAIVKSIADLHGATLSLGPLARSAGCSVLVRFPARAVGAARPVGETCANWLCQAALKCCASASLAGSRTRSPGTWSDQS